MQPDIIIIGSGPLGAICARNLAEQGLKVLIIEAGDIITSPPGSHLRNQPFYQKNEDKFFDAINELCFRFNKNALSVGLPGANITEAFGGQSLLWTNNCPRPAKHELWSSFDDNTWNELLTRGEKYLSVNTHLFDQSIRQQKIYDKLTPLLALEDRIIENVPVAAHRLENDKLEYIATNEILNIPADILENIWIKYNTKVLEIIHSNGEATGVKVKQDNEIVIIEAKYIITAAGMFNTTQLLFDSNIRPHALGKYLHFHPLYIAQIVLHEEFCAQNNVIDQSPRVCISPTLSYPWHTMLLKDIFPEISTEKVLENNLLEIQMFIPIEVQENNQMILSEESPKFNMHLSSNDQAMLESAKQDFINISMQLGRFRNGCEPFLFDFGFTHPMGTCRMGEDSQTSVADQNGKVHGFSNLYLATVGLIPTCIAVNPTLTAAAIAIHSTDCIIQNIKINDKKKEHDSAIEIPEKLPSNISYVNMLIMKGWGPSLAPVKKDIPITPKKIEKCPIDDVQYETKYTSSLNP